MARAAFKILPSNPNPTSGCVCSPDAKVQSCKPPYIVFTHSESWSPKNPHIVLSMECACAAVAKAGRTAQGRSQLPEVEVREVEVVREPTDAEIVAAIRGATASPTAASEQG